MFFYHDILLFLHLVGLAAGLGVGFANMFIMRWAAEAQTEEDASLLRSLPARLSQLSQIGLVVLVITGLLLLFTDNLVRAYNPWNDFWFYLKLLGSAAMIAIAYAMYQAQQQIKRGEQPRIGNFELGPYMSMMGPAMGGLALLVVLFSAFVFH